MNGSFWDNGGWQKLFCLTACVFMAVGTTLGYCARRYAPVTLEPESQSEGKPLESGETTPETGTSSGTQPGAEEPSQTGGGLGTAANPLIPLVKSWDRIDDAVTLPSRFDYREIGRAPVVEDQGELGTCWAFASLMAMESTMLPEENWNFSEDHMSMHNSFLLGQAEGGQYAMSMAYLLAWQGPVTEESDPYGDGQSPDDLAPVKHVQEIRLLEAKNYDRVKRAVYTTGGVQSSLYTRLLNYTSKDQYYEPEHFAYYYPGSERPNHNVVIIGWDDDYPKENFSEEPEGDGAFICLNSWGTRFGEEGCLYVSYYDTNIGDVNVLYSGITDPDTLTGIYQTDLCGWIGQLGYGKESAWFANTYRAGNSRSAAVADTGQTAEKLKAVGFYATMPGSSYELYAVTGRESPSGSSFKKPLAKGTLTDSGFYTIPLEEELPLKAGEPFVVAVKVTTPGAVHPVAIEYQAPDSGAKIDLSDGTGFLSADGIQWVSAEQTQNCNVCLKAYTGE